MLDTVETQNAETALRKSLDLGCGVNPRNKFDADEVFGVDLRDGLGDNIVAANLITDPIPFPDNYFDFVTAFDFIEHVPRIIFCPDMRAPFVELMNEVYRVLKPGGRFFSSTPAYPHPAAFQDPTHVNIITEKTFPSYFDDRIRGAKMYGFRGFFRLHSQNWRNQHLETTMIKVMGPSPRK